ncbi:MAG: hydroxyacylglutathione hydrolase [Myxococcales bacterium]|nr:hydroxyacylglutathione hydrolase [Myxococcales bacterium]
MEHVVTRPTAPFTLRSGLLEVHQVPVWEDNLVWILVDPATKTAAAVDGPEAGPVLAYLEARGLTLTTIFNTHTHADHVGINTDLADRGLLANMRVVGAAKARDAVPGITEAVDEGDTVTFGPVTAKVMLTEGHINGHVSYVFEDVVFCGDTLFAGGCGYLFDGPPAKMHDSLTRLSQLAPETRVCCAHEYTQDNLRFAWSVEPENETLAGRIKDVWARRGKGECVVPSTVADELATNPFLRHHSAPIRGRVAAAYPERDLSSAAEVFAATRQLKNDKVYKSITDQDLPLA